MSALVANETFEALCLAYKNRFNHSKLKTFAFSKEGFLGLFLELNAKIGVSLGESQAVIDGAKLYEQLGFEVVWIGLNPDGKVNLFELKNKTMDFLFIFLCHGYLCNNFNQRGEKPNSSQNYLQWKCALGCLK